MTPGRGSQRDRARTQEREASKVRRQKIFVGIGGVLLLGLVAFQLPGLLGGGSSGAKASATTHVVATPVTQAAPGASGKKAAASDSEDTLVLPHSIVQYSSRNLFIPQVAVPESGPTITASLSEHGPAVRATNFVVKDVFIPQIKAPAATTATSTLVSPGAGGSSAPVAAGAGYIVVLGSIPGIGPASQQTAERLVVAAKNAGLKDVVANDSVPGESGAAGHFTIYTGPYPTLPTLQSELLRALHNGYPGAHAQQLPTSSGKGF